MSLKRILFLVSLILFSFILGNAQSPYARRIYPVVVDPISCSENQVFYNMVSNKLLICVATNTIAEVLTGTGTGITGSGANTRVAFFTSASVLSSDANFTFNSTSDVLTATGFAGNLTGNVTGTASGNEVPLTFSSPLIRTINTISCPTCYIIPDQTGNGGKYLTTDGTNTSWGTISSGITNSAGANVVPKSDGTNLVASRIEDTGTNITIDSGDGTTTIGDVNGIGSGARLIVADPSASVRVNGVAFTPEGVGETALGSGALPFLKLYLGDAATNNIQLIGTATAARVITLPDKTGTIILNTDISAFYKSGTPGIAGNGTLNTNSKDSAGKVTATGTGSSTIVLTFSTAFANAPACIVTNETTSNLVRPISTTTNLTIAATIVTGDSISYTCLGY